MVVFGFVGVPLSLDLVGLVVVWVQLDDEMAINGEVLACGNARPWVIVFNCDACSAL